jgi:hypothetical protein
MTDGLEMSHVVMVCGSSQASFDLFLLSLVPRATSFQESMSDHDLALDTNH